MKCEHKYWSRFEQQKVIAEYPRLAAAGARTGSRPSGFCGTGTTVWSAVTPPNGYASVRVGLRGSGDSEGVLREEYLEQELADAEEALAWLAAQPWCSGRTGMMGISWGGFNALQVAARRPPGLGAIITACSTDDRYANDVHYMGGCLLSARRIPLWSASAGADVA